MSPESKKELFVLFGRASKSIKNHKHTGIGLGLSFCKGVLDKMKSSIICKSELDKGTTFTINLGVKANRNDRGLSETEHQTFLDEITRIGEVENQENPDLVSTKGHLENDMAVPLTNFFCKKELQF